MKVLLLALIVLLLAVPAAHAKEIPVDDTQISMVWEDGGGGGWTGPMGGCFWLYFPLRYVGWFYHPQYGHAVLPC